MDQLLAVWISGAFVQLLILAPMIFAAPAARGDLRRWVVAALAAPLWPAWLILLGLDVVRVARGGAGQ